MVCGLVVPDGGGEGQDAGEDGHGDAGFGAAAVAFEAELGFGVLLTDSMIWRSGHRNRVPGRAGSVLVAGRMTAMPVWASRASKAAER